MTTLEHKGYTGSVQWSAEDNCYYGKVLGISDLVSYAGDDLEQLPQRFREAVDEYVGTLEVLKK